MDHNARNVRWLILYSYSRPETLRPILGEPEGYLSSDPFSGAARRVSFALTECQSSAASPPPVHWKTVGDTRGTCISSHCLSTGHMGPLPCDKPPYSSLDQYQFDARSFRAVIRGSDWRDGISQRRAPLILNQPQPSVVPGTHMLCESIQSENSFVHRELGAYKHPSPSCESHGLLHTPAQTRTARACSYPSQAPSIPAACRLTVAPHISHAAPSRT